MEPLELLTSAVPQYKYQFKYQYKYPSTSLPLLNTMSLPQSLATVELYLDELY